MVLKKDMTCMKCGYEWRKRTDNPTFCPRCRNPKYNEHKNMNYAKPKSKPLYNKQPEKKEEFKWS